MTKKPLEQDFATGEKKFEQSLEYRFPEELKLTEASVARLDKWFCDVKFGAFIHFGLYSQLAGMYKGKVSKHRYRPMAFPSRNTDSLPRPSILWSSMRMNG